MPTLRLATSALGLPLEGREQDASRARQWRTVIKMDVAEGISRSISLLSGEVIPSFESYWR